MKLVCYLLFIFSLNINAASNSELENRINILAEELQAIKSNGPGLSDKLHIGGYGEVTFSKKEEGEENSSSSDATSDSKRFVLFVGYKYNDNWSVLGEIEVEHANEIYTEQAYVEYSKSDAFNLRFGTLLLPVGHINLYHEANTFNSVQRPQTDTVIIPSTWRENGVGLYGKKDNWEYHLYIVNSVSEGIGETGLRGGRQKASKADSHHAAYVGNLNYHFKSDTMLGTSVYQGRVNGTSSKAAISLYEVHGHTMWNNWGFKFLAAKATADKAEEFNQEHSANLAEELYGNYLEVFYNINLKRDEKLIPFFRYEKVDTQGTVVDGMTKNQSLDKIYNVIGLSYKPLANIALKADYAKVMTGAENGADEWNLGVAWQF